VEYVVAGICIVAAMIICAVFIYRSRKKNEKAPSSAVKSITDDKSARLLTVENEPQEVAFRMLRWSAAGLMRGGNLTRQ
jgi:uncharacterized protein YxeA